MTVNDYKEAACATAGPVEEDMDTLELQPQKPPPPDNENLLGRVLAEFDGTTVLCRVCGDKASGFHYGVHSCEGCKGFFRRSIQQKIQYRPCTKNQQCTIQRINRNRCQYCRLRKCISVGMSRDAVRFGRVPKREKARILAAMQQSSHSRTLEKVVATELEDEHRLLATVIAAHHDTCDFTKDKVEPMLARAREQPSYIACPPTLACPLNPSPHPVIGQNEMLQDFSKRFSPAIRGVVEFAKRIPGFNLLAQDDQVTLLKAGVFEVLLVRLACMFDTATASMICLNGQVLKRESLQNSANARFLMDSMFDFADRINAMHLSDSEIALFCSVVVIAPDRPGLRNVELIEKMQNKLKAALQIVVSQNHHSQAHILDDLIKKVPDLRTLNTLHSEKLLAYKMTEQQQMMQQQQQQQQYQIWTNSPQPQREDQDCNSKSPTGSSWSPSSDSIEDAKSPQGSVSSTESMGSPEITSLNDFHHQNGGGSHHNNHHNNHPNHNNHQNHISANVANAPLLAATLAGGFCPHRHRANSGSGSSGDDDLPATSHLIHNGLTITPVSRPHNINNNNSNINVHMRFRKLDSPSDSGIESGTEKVEKHSAPTSICSSPRPSMDDHQQHIVEDMPVLKRVLQAPPLWDTNSLMDEAYKPHKKFRVGLRNKDSAEAEPMQSTSPQPPPVNTVVPSQLQMQLTAPSPPQSSLSSTHSTLAKSLMEGPRMTAEQMQRTNIIHHFIMRDEHAATTVVSSPMVTASPTSCPYKMTGNGLQHQQPPSWATSVITTTGRHHLHPNGSPPLTHHQLQQAAADFNGRLSFVHHPQSPHSTSPAPPQTRSPTFSSPHSTLLSPLCHNNNTKVTELQVEVVDFQQPLNLSKKSPSPPPRSMKVVKMEV